MPISINGTTGISGVDGSAAAPALQGSDTNTGIAFGSDVIIGSTGGTERFRCDSSGRWLLGTSTARNNVYIGGNSATQTVQIENSGNTVNTGLSLLTYSSGNYHPYITIGTSKSDTPGTNAAVSANDDLGIINFTGNDGTNFRTAAWIRAQVDGTPGSADMPGRLVFSTTADGASSPTERVRITQEGIVGIGVAPAAGGARLAIYGANTVLGTAIISSPKGTNDSHIHYGTNGDWYIRPATNSGSVFIKNYVADSDARLKENIADSPYGLDCLLSLQPRTFNWIDGDGSEQVGFVAQEVEQIAPSFVSEGQWKSINYQAITSTLVKALQEAVAKIETLEARLSALESA